jgi:hypothetical protein
MSQVREYVWMARTEERLERCNSFLTISLEPSYSPLGDQTVIRQHKQTSHPSAEPSLAVHDYGMNSSVSQLLLLPWDIFLLLKKPRLLKEANGDISPLPLTEIDGRTEVPSIQLSR